MSQNWLAFGGMIGAVTAVYAVAALVPDTWGVWVGFLMIGCGFAGFILGVWAFDYSPLPNDNFFRQHGTWQPLGFESGYIEEYESPQKTLDEYCDSQDATEKQ